MLEHLGENIAATILMEAIERVTSSGNIMPPDLGGSATTREITDAMIGLLEGHNI